MFLWAQWVPVLDTFSFEELNEPVVSQWGSIFGILNHASISVYFGVTDIKGKKRPQR